MFLKTEIASDGEWNKPLFVGQLVRSQGHKEVVRSTPSARLPFHKADLFALTCPPSSSSYLDEAADLSGQTSKASVSLVHFC